MSIRKTGLLLLTLTFIALGFKPLGGAVLAYRAARTLAELTSGGGGAFPCRRPPLSAPAERLALVEVLPALPSPAMQSAAYCALGDQTAAGLLYSQAAAAGDTWAALQVLSISSGQEVTPGLPENLSLREFIVVKSIDPAIDWRPLIRQVVASQPVQDASWVEWLVEGNRLEGQQQWAAALAWYQEGLDRQTTLGAVAVRSNLALRAGVMLQSQVEPHDLHQALAYYAEALRVQNFSGDVDRIYTHIYRGQALFELSSEFGPAPALAEFQQALALDGHNFTATEWTGIVYNEGYNDPAQALIWFQRAASLQDTNRDAYYYLGLTYTKLGQNTAAAQAFDRVLELDPNWDAVRKLRQALP